MGKKSIHHHFSALSPQPNQKLKCYSCNYCKKKYAENITRMRKHLYQECRCCPQELKKILKKSKLRKRKNSNLNSTDESFHVEDVNEADNRASTAMISNENLPNNMNDSNNTHKNYKIDNFCDKMSKKEEDSIQELLAEAIYTSGTPLCITENPYWLKVFNTLRPSFNVPSRNQLSNNLLNSIFIKTLNMVNEKIESAATVGVQCDAWSNIRNEGIINFTVTTPTPVFYKTIPTGTESQTSFSIAEKIGNVIDALGVKKVIGICTDNCAAMKSAWTLIDRKYNVDKLYCYGCAAHIPNLLMKDIGSQETVKTLVTSATTIVKGIKEVQVMSAIFKEIQSQDNNRVFITLKLPAKTRFGSTIIMIESLCVNKHNLQALAISPKAITLWKSTNRCLVLNEEFWQNLQKILQLMKPIAKWINILESDNPLINQVPECFYDLNNHFNDVLNSVENIFLEEEKIGIYNCLENRKTMALRPIHYAANLLDPQLKGRNLNESETIEAHELIINLGNKLNLNNDKILKDLTDYLAESNMWSHEYVKRTSIITSACQWWQTTCQKSSLSKIAVAILTLPATSAATERSFSTQGWIHSSKRNRLSVDRAGEIAYIAKNLKLLNPPPKNSEKELEQEEESNEEDEEMCAILTEHEEVEFLEDEFNQY